MEKQNLSADEQMRRLGNRWVFDCANRLMADENMERKAAFRQAVRAYHLLELLGRRTSASSRTLTSTSRNSAVCTSEI